MIPRCSLYRGGYGRWIVAVLALGAGLACSGASPASYGEPVEMERAVALGELLSSSELPVGEQVVVSGTIGHVCRSAGCWLVLEEDVSDRHYELYVDLKPAASFTLESSASGRKATLQGRLAGSAPDLELHAVGLIFE